MDFKPAGLGSRLAREARYHMALREWLEEGMKRPRPKVEPMPEGIKTPGGKRTLLRKAIREKS